MKIDLVFIIIICLFFIWAYWTSPNHNKQKQVEPMANTSDDVKEAVRQVYNADVESIRNLSEVATKLQAGGLIMPGHFNVKSDNENVIHLESSSNNPYLSLGKAGTWGKKKFYIQNVDAHTENPTFRVGIHDVGPMMDMSKSHGVRWGRKDGRWTHFDWSDGKNYIRGNTEMDGDTNINGSLTVSNRNILNELTGLQNQINELKAQTVKYNEFINVTNTGTANHEEHGKYIGFCGAGACGMVNVGLTNDKSRGVLRIERN